MAKKASIKRKPIDVPKSDIRRVEFMTGSCVGCGRHVTVNLKIGNSHRVRNMTVTCGECGGLIELQ